MDIEDKRYKVRLLLEQAEDDFLMERKRYEQLENELLEQRQQKLWFLDELANRAQHFFSQVTDQSDFIHEALREVEHTRDNIVYHYETEYRSLEDQWDECSTYYRQLTDRFEEEYYQLGKEENQ